MGGAALRSPQPRGARLTNCSALRREHLAGLGAVRRGAGLARSRCCLRLNKDRPKCSRQLPPHAVKRWTWARARRRTAVRPVRTPLGRTGAGPPRRTPCAARARSGTGTCCPWADGWHNGRTRSSCRAPARSRRRRSAAAAAARPPLTASARPPRPRSSATASRTPLCRKPPCHGSASRSRPAWPP
eukprot:scaffold9565_cov106-Isochrysis_galbana.AAC.1